MEDSLFKLEISRQRLIVRRTSLICALLVIAFSALGQDAPDLQSFLAKFLPAPLPFCTDYSEEEMAFINPHDEDRFDRLLEDYKPDSLILSPEEIHTFLLTGKDSVSVQNIWSTDTVARVELYEYLEEHTYFAGRLLLEAQGFVGLTFEIMDHVHGSEKFFCTLERSGKLISLVPLGFYVHSGSYARDDGTRGWWYPSRGSCIDKQHVIKTYDFDHQVNGEFEALRIFEIQPNGHIWKRFETQ